MAPGSDSVSSNWIGRRFPGPYARFVYYKRIMPRWLFFPLVFFVTMLINAIWVLPVTISYMRRCGSVDEWVPGWVGAS